MTNIERLKSSTNTCTNKFTCFTKYKERDFCFLDRFAKLLCLQPNSITSHEKPLTVYLWALNMWPLQAARKGCASSIMTLILILCIFNDRRDSALLKNVPVFSGNSRKPEKKND